MVFSSFLAIAVAVCKSTFPLVLVDDVAVTVLPVGACVFERSKHDLIENGDAVIGLAEQTQKPYYVKQAADAREVIYHLLNSQSCALNYIACPTNDDISDDLKSDCEIFQTSDDKY